MIPSVTVTNATNNHIVFKNVTFRNAGFVNPRLFNNGNRVHSAITEHTDWAPVFTVENSGGGNVTLNGLVPLF